MISRYMQVVWLYMIGMVIIFIGVYMIIINSGPTSFIIMLAGLAVATMGAAHGRRMREDAGLSELFRPEPRREETQQGEQQQEEPREMPEEEPGKYDDAREQKQRMAYKPSVPQAGDGPRSMLPTSADIVELVCPECGMENDEKSFFCWSCGFRLRKKPSAMEKAKPVKVEPETIEVIGGRKIAKVMVCPKCGASNKESDKYCWSCGKKIKTEHAARPPKKEKE
jgi:predicted RNA-binding Zn-ribbon protein involved in translation (DUF1610 family)